MTDVVSGQKVPYRGVTAPPQTDLRSRREEGVRRLGVPPSGRILLADRGPQKVGGGGLWPARVLGLGSASLEISVVILVPPGRG